MRYATDQEKSDSKWTLAQLLSADDRDCWEVRDNNGNTYRFNAPYWFGTRVDISPQCELRYNVGGESDPDLGDFPTLSDLHRRGRARYIFPYKEAEFVPSFVIRSMSTERANEIAEKLSAKLDVEIDPDDVKEVYLSWKAGYKTGLRNEGRGYHLFCPSGMLNPFSISATTLDESSADWQKTYQF